MSDLAVRDHVAVHDVRRPVLGALVEDGLIEDMIVAGVGVGAAQARIMLEDVVPVEHVQRKERRIWIRIRRQSLLEHDLAQRWIKVQTIIQCIDNNVFRQVLPISVQQAMIGQSVHHRTRTTEIIWSSRFLMR